MLEIERIGHARSVVDHAACPGCKDARLDRVAAPDRWIEDAALASLRGRLGLSRCAGCGLVFTNPRPSDEMLAAYYGGVIQPRRNALAPAAELPLSEKAAHLLGWIEQHVPTGALLDFGCTDGALLELAKSRGWRVQGFEIGLALERCRARGLQVTNRLESFPHGSFDVIVLNQVMEHVEQRDALLDRLRPLIAPGGKIVIACPNARSLRARLAHPLLVRHAGLEERYRAFPIHLAYFDPSTLAALLARRGFTVERTSTYGLGLDRLFAEPEDELDDTSRTPRAPSSPEPRRRPPSPARRAKDLVLALLHRLELGEHVVVIASADPRKHERRGPR